jgi:hypothetical protein
VDCCGNDWDMRKRKFTGFGYRSAAGLSERDSLLRFKDGGRSILSWHLGFQLRYRESERALQFAQGGIVAAIAVMLQEKRRAAKYADENL